MSVKSLRRVFKKGKVRKTGEAKGILAEKLEEMGNKCNEQRLNLEKSQIKEQTVTF